MNDFAKWKKERNRPVYFITMMVAFVVFMLLQSIYSKSTDVFAHQSSAQTDSLYFESGKNKNGVNRILVMNNTSDSARLKFKLDSIDIALKNLNNMFFLLEKQTEIRQNDIRQETNNIINKFNGNIEWWIFLLGIICGVAPILLTILTHQKDEKYMELLNSDYRNMRERIKEHYKDISDLKEELIRLEETLKNNDKDRTLSWETKQKELRLAISFMYIASFTRRSRFQSSPERDLAVEKLMREIVYSMLEYLSFKNPDLMKERQIDLSFWIFSAMESLELLRPFIDNTKVDRQMYDVLKCVHTLRERYYKGETFKHDDKDIKSLKNKLETLKAKKWE